ncbi:prepilin-type N-terminal cleavage/methylation domain-containing protein [Venenivibrio stagnispumantis]|uniref:Prepilin-type N-terminal cleavage/methylation domain-containing protein n=1 Tax=Venenivibrio stagnispumantis TaxID=407998 RepID=A0AA45WII6_9AQUI|nr:prepilin-type N-terminal cleavage/methylation domain-containing protein [Venenivibrio stagnispumantis]MCW4572614.1 prepilin-type N-terminal cleavage/methylation domain-containing protein [Venenivibrio stagnispumantis]SMP00571.1 prepilin-type N-terminal cleavage/methylation domain-containing protein [Venenivibrio stagnispumantis]
MKQQKGFTLIELAIVLAIIGIILGAILKGQELINNAKAKRLLNDVKGWATLEYTFYDRYGRFAGDGDGDGLIDAGAFATSQANFGANYIPPTSALLTPTTAYQNSDFDAPVATLEAAQLLPAAQNAPQRRTNVTNAFNGITYPASVYIDNVGTFNVIAVKNIPCFAAKVIDSNIDGSIGANVGYVREIDNTGALTGNNTWSCDANNNEQQLVSLVYFFDKRPN